MRSTLHLKSVTVLNNAHSRMGIVYDFDISINENRE